MGRIITRPYGVITRLRCLRKPAHVKLHYTWFFAREAKASKCCVDAFCKMVKNISSAVVHFSHGKNSVGRGYERRFRKSVGRCTARIASAQAGDGSMSSINSKITFASSSL